ncbi:MAG: hypothetical protein Alpg2KO_03900 [Alphaproteobacteria bacterium]
MSLTHTQPVPDPDLPGSFKLLAIERGVPGGLKVALVADELTSSCIAHDCRFIDVHPWHNKTALKIYKPDLLLVESAWKGHWERWKHKIADYPDRHPMRKHAWMLDRMVANARDLGIPTVFWNKEDGVHFHRFIRAAKLFDHIFTVDENCHDRYRAEIGPDVSVQTLMFPVQPALHSFTGFNFTHDRACFVGSYSKHVHPGRKVWQDLVFGQVSASGMGLTVIDRNSDRLNRTYRYPDLEGLKVRPAVSHAQTAAFYKAHIASLNVNTVTDSRSMYSRRLVEILACGGIAVTSPALSVDTHFADYCHVIETEAQAADLFGRLQKDGLSEDDLARARAGAEYVAEHHTWENRLKQIAQTVGL